MTSGFFQCTVELSLNGLLRKYPELGRRRPTFRGFLTEAIREAIKIQIYRRLTHSNYEHLDWKENDTHKKPPKNLFAVQNPLKISWDLIEMVHVSLLSIQTTHWIKILYDRMRDEDEKNFIARYQ